MSALEKLIENMTLGELARLANMTVERVIDLVLGGAPPTRSATAVPPVVASARGPKGKIARGGLRLDHVLTTLASLGGPAKLEDVRARTGGSQQQVRAALQKLAEAAKVKITGERRGTRYAAR